MACAFHCTRGSCRGNQRCSEQPRQRCSGSLLCRSGGPLPVGQPFPKVRIIVCGVGVSLVFHFRSDSSQACASCAVCSGRPGSTNFLPASVVAGGRIGFDWGFLVAGGATVLLLSANAKWI